LIVGFGLVSWVGGKTLFQQQGTAYRDIAVTSAPSDANVFLDDLYMGKTPLTLREVNGGAHVLRVTKEDSLPWAVNLSAAEKTSAIIAQLDPVPKGSLAVTTSPSKAQVFMDGEYAGVTPAVFDRLETGTYQVRIQKDGYAPWHGSVVVEDKQQAQVSAELMSKTEWFYLGEIDSDPLRLVNYTELAHHYMIKRQYDEAFDTFAKAIDIAVGSNADREHVKRLYQEIDRVHTGQYRYADKSVVEKLRPRVETLLAEAVNRHPDATTNYRALARLYRRRPVGGYERGIRVFEGGLKSVPEGRPRRSILRELVGIIYRRGESIEVEARRHRKAGKPDEAHASYQRAIAQYEEVIRRYPASYHAKKALAQIVNLYAWRYAERNSAKAREMRARNARRFLKAYPDDGRCRTMLYDLAGAYASRSPRDYKTAVTLLREFITRFPDDDRCAAAQYSLAGHVMWYLKDRKQGIEEYRKLIRRYPKDDRCATAQYYIAYYGYRSIPNAHGQTAKEYLRFVNEYPYDDRCPSALQSVVRLQRDKLKQYAAAIRTCQRLVKEYPKSDLCPAAQAMIGHIYLNDLRDPSKALTAYRTLLKRHPDWDQNALTWKYIGDCHQQQKHLADAKSAYATAIAKYPHAGSIYQVERALRRLPR